MRGFSRLWCLCFLFPVSLTAQETGFKGLFDESTFSGQVQTEAQYCFRDSVNDPSEYVNRFLSNTYVDGRYMSRRLDVGARFEMYKNPLPGFEKEFNGVGVPHWYVGFHTEKLQVTGGNFYDQFGSGVIFRTYQERTLGIDNALCGGRIAWQPLPWLNLKALAGVQRYYWSLGHSWIKGADAEIYIEEFFTKLSETGHHLLLGGSFVSKNESLEDILVSSSQKINLPRNVGAFSFRMNYRKDNWNLQAEYAWKANDPSFDNQYVFHPGQFLLISGGYSRPGLGVSLSVKHSDNMAFRSSRTERGRMLFINYLPAFSRQHTYVLAAMYPYATQAQGEMAFQGDVLYHLKKGTLLGGSRGMDVRLNYSRVNGLRKDGLSEKGTYGYHTRFFRMSDEVYYQDVNFELSKRITPELKLNGMYMHQVYNQAKIEGHGNNGNIIYSDIAVLEGTYKCTKKMALRIELQYLSTAQDHGDWGAAVLELSVSPHWIFSLTDLYNLGDTRRNYLAGTIAYTAGAHRLQLTGGSQREGYNCAGGICRYVPATKGIALSYAVNF